MTTFGWDASNYDAPPTARDSVDFYTHKAAEGHHFYYDAEYAASLTNARNLGIPVLGAYFVTHPGTVSDQVDWFLSIVDSETPWWRQYPWIWQIDAEKFSYMSRAPNLDEINGFGDLICSRARVPASQVIVYAPRWLYGDSLRGLRYRLWASNYGSNPAVPYRQAYPGDGSSRWDAYSGQTPIILQYGSRTTIAGQTTCDANAFRGTLDQLKALLTGDDDMTPEQDARQKNIDAHCWAMVNLQEAYSVPFPANNPAAKPMTIYNPMAIAINTLLRKVDIDPAELAAIGEAAKAGAQAGVAAGAEDLVAAVVAAVPESVQAQVEAAMRRVLGSLDGATPQA